MAFSTRDRINSEPALNFDDVLITPDAQVNTADQVVLQSQFSTSIALHIPFVSSPAITDANIAIQIAQQGGIGIIGNTVSLSAQADIVRQVKRFQSRVSTDLVMVTPETSIIEALEYKQRYNISLMPVVEGGTQFLAGFIELQDDMSIYDPEHTVSHYMSEQPYVTVTQGTELDDVYRMMSAENAAYAAVTDHQNRFVALIKKSDKDKAESFPHATIDAKGALRVAAMVGTSAKDYDRVNALMDAGADAILVYAPHGHSKEMLDIVTHIRRQRSADVDVIAGNIMTEQGALAAIDAGANSIFIDMNTEYKMLGMGVPDLTAILSVVEVASLQSIPVIAGHVSDLTHQIKAFAAGSASIAIEDIAKINEIIEPLRKAVAYTGCNNLREFALRTRFTRITNK